MVNSRNLYGILVKFPEPGRVKTRLASEIGPEEAAGVYRLIVERTMKNTRPSGSEYERVLFYAPSDRLDRFSIWFPGERLLPQRGSDIGEIMANTLADLFREGAEKAVITGSDIPLLGTDVIRQAFYALEGTDIVIGPATDGGYYLIGMKSLHEGLFRGIPWGTGTVFRETVSAAAKMHLSWKAVVTLPDVDTKEDLLRSDLGKGSAP